MARTSILRLVAMLCMVAATGVAAQAQDDWDQATACPGWNNPTNFTSGMGGAPTFARYAGSGVYVSSDKPCPNPISATTGWNSVGPNYTASQLSTVYTDNSTAESHRQFLIMTNTTGTDPNTGNALKYVPTQYNTTSSGNGEVVTQLTKSIRIGDLHYSNANAGNGWSGAMLTYTMMVTPDNAMMYIYYAIVAESPTHGMKGNPTFIIRVMKKDAANNWKQISDTMAYYISSASTSYSSELCPNMRHVSDTTPGAPGWHSVGSGYNAVKYKDWDKAALNLGNYLNEEIQIQVIIYDCLYNAHYAYAYIAGECRQLEPRTSGCPAGISTDVTTLIAASHMKNYVWYASDWGVSIPANGCMPGGDNEHFTFRRLTPEISTDNTYHVQASDFRVTRRTNPLTGNMEVCDSMGNMQTFRCEMTSSIDPYKPYKTNAYVNVTNNKPTMQVDSLYTCDGVAKLWNNSYVPGNPELAMLSQTQWMFYNNEYAEGTAIETLTGDSVAKAFTDTEMKSVRVRTYTTDPTCYSDAIYSFQPRLNPKVGMTISDRVLCDAAETVLRDTTSGDNLTRTWFFREPGENSSMTPVAALTGQGNTNRTVTRAFTHSVEPIELQVRNGMYYLNPSNLNDTVWCVATARDTVAVFLHPELDTVGENVVCEGSLTNVTVTARGVDSCTYEWSLTPDVVTGNLPTGPTLRVTPYADTATYYIKVTSPQGCVAWDSMDMYLIRPKLAIEPIDGRICPGYTAKLTGLNADHYSWTASPRDATLDGQENNETIEVKPTVTTVYTMVGHGTNNCDASPLRQTVTVVPLPVPNVKLTPGFIDTDKPTLTLRDQSAHGVSSSWLFNDGTTATGREVSHRFNNCEGLDSVKVELTSYNALNCPTVYPFNIAVNVFTAWFPNAFTPGSSDGNDKFKLYTINDYEFFHIYIYNRRGALVYESDNPNFEWDGTAINGEKCPQGAYIYTCRYRKPGTTTLSSQQGAVTLVR